MIDTYQLDDRRSAKLTSTAEATAIAMGNALRPVCEQRTATPRILMDLKPAFDGFGGIPQETRLLFSALKQEHDWRVNGLIQHGGRRLRGGLKDGDAGRDVSKQINQLSKLIVSVSERPYSGFLDAISDQVNTSFALGVLRARVGLGFSVRRSLFDSRLFPDFVWRTFFAKTLNADLRETVSCDDYYVMQPSRKDFHRLGLQSLAFSSRPRYPVVDTRGFDYFIAQTPFPGRVSHGTQMIVRYHDAVPLLLPHTIKDKAFHQATHYQSLRSNVESGATFACVSDATRRDLLTVFPQVESRAFVIHNIVSEEYFEEESPRPLVARLVRNRLADVEQFTAPSKGRPIVIGDDFQYLLMVSTIEPRKNHTMLISAWERLKYATNPDLKLVIVGNIGWDAGEVLKAFKPWALKAELFYLQDVPSAELRVLYRHALATVCPSLAEGFDYSGVEAMRCGSPVLSSDIAVHREIYGDASLYFDPYSVQDASRVLADITSPDNAELRQGLVKKGLLQSRRYLPENILPLWKNVLDSTQ
jgi:glycosyltransferase involved in cell wall biosynthesis